MTDPLTPARLTEYSETANALLSKAARFSSCGYLSSEAWDRVVEMIAVLLAVNALREPSAQVTALTQERDEARRGEDARAVELQAIGDEFERIGIPADGQIDGSLAVWQVQQARFRWERAEQEVARLRAQTTAAQLPTPTETAALRELADYCEQAGWICTPHGNIPEVLRDAAAALSLPAEPPAPAQAPLQPIPIAWAEAANSARGLCESEANKWETGAPATAAHWRSVSTRLAAIYLTQDHLGAEAAPAQPSCCPGCGQRMDVVARCVHCGVRVEQIGEQS